MILSVLLIHGIGGQKKDWAQDITRDLKTKALAEFRVLLKDGSPKKIDEALDIQSVYWQDIFAARQEELRRILDRESGAARRVASSWLARVFEIFNPARWFMPFQHEVITDYIGDIIGYLNAETRALVYARIDDALKALSNPGGSKRPLTLVAHSLGTVVASDYVYDHAKTRHLQKETGFHPTLRLDNFFTIGSPLALFSLKYGGPEAFQSPIHVESDFGRWLNLYDTDDPVGMPLHPLNEAYQKAVSQDVKVESGAYGLSHVGYFTKSKVLNIVAKKLAIDWARVNGTLPVAELVRQGRAFDETLGGLAA